MRGNPNLVITFASSLVPHALALLTVLAGLLVSSASPAAADEGALDRSRVLKAAPTAEPPPLIVVEPFGTAATDFGSGEKPGKPKAEEVARQMEASAPIALAQSIVAQLQKRGVLGGAVLGGAAEEPAGALRLRGEFTVLNPGSRGKRFWVGMGAGRSRVCVKGELVDPAGQQLITFEHCRSGTGAYTFAGGRPEGMMINDLAGTADKIGIFLEAWEAGRVTP